MNEPRAFRDERDLPAMLDVLINDRQANNGSYYIHSGDMRWWVYYQPLEDNQVVFHFMNQWGSGPYTR